jgi:CRISPR/Cas system-associated endonuclease Cas1
MGEVVSLGEHKARKLGFPNHIAVGTYIDAKGNQCVRLAPKDESKDKPLQAVQYKAAVKPKDNAFTYSKGFVEQQVLKIQELLQSSIDIMSYMPQLRSVQAREQAVIDSMKIREKADQLAASNGWVIRKGDDNAFIISPKEQG